jgi:hypothetical protein
LQVVAEVVIAKAAAVALEDTLVQLLENLPVVLRPQ